MKWTPDAMDRLERAIVEGARVQITRRGTPYVVIPLSIRSAGALEELVARTYTGDELAFPLDEIERVEFIH